MTLPPSIRVGSAASPRWFDVSLDQLPAYVHHLVMIGATAVELVVLPGDAPVEVARVHLLEALWEEAVRLFSAAGFLISVHAPLTAAFRLDHFGRDDESTDGWRRICRLVATIEERQGAVAPLVIHSIATDSDGAATAQALDRLIDSLVREGAAGAVAIELRAPYGPDDHRFDRNRLSLAQFVTQIGDERVGICWDVANDWLASRRTGVPYTLPDASFVTRVGHVHVHDAHASLGLHAPLQDASVPWKAARDLLITGGWGGRVTLEIRYRLASELGDPWAVLGKSFARFIARD